MAGWTVVESDIAENPGPNELLVDIELGSDGSGLKSPSYKELGYCFDNFVKALVKEICVLDRGYWPFPPMLGNGESVDLLKLFLVVREKGGGDVVSKNGLWDLVAKESGFGLNLASSLKLVYVKYLDALEKWLERLVERKEDALSDSDPNPAKIVTQLGAEFKGFLSGMVDSKHLEWIFESESKMSTEMEPNEAEKLIVQDEESTHVDSTKSDVCSVEGGKLSNDGEKCAPVDCFLNGKKECEDVLENMQSDLTKSDVDDLKSVAIKMDGDNISPDTVEDDAGVLGSNGFEEPLCHRKRKRESMYRMLDWVTGIARNPCDEVVVSLPESSKWSSYGNDEIWKQVLSARGALLVKRNVDKSAESASWQKNSKMHPCMYEDDIGSNYNLRERLKCAKKPPGKPSSQAQVCSQSSPLPSQTDSESCTGGSFDGDSSTRPSILDLPVEKQIPLGPHFQAEIPECTGVVSGSDLKWLGNKDWPDEKARSKFLIERDPIGKGRQDSCACQVRNSVECVKFHCGEKQLKVKRELGMAFYIWRFNRMGDQVKLIWTEKEEKKFKAIVRSNRASLDRCFWDEIYKSFPTKTREGLVSYYYNVFLLQRRAYQNRFTPNNIDSDDDESEFVAVANGPGHDVNKSPGSILRSAKKSCRKV